MKTIFNIFIILFWFAIAGFTLYHIEGASLLKGFFLVCIGIVCIDFGALRMAKAITNG